MPLRKAPTALLFLLGLIDLGVVARGPQFASFRAVDVVQLLASGMLFGVALASLIGNIRAKAQE
jgi:hypothetical protein